MKSVIDPVQAWVRIRSTTRITAISAAAAFAVANAVGSSTAGAATVYWDGVTGGWDTPANFSTASNATTPNPATSPGSGDDVVFNISTANGGDTVYLNANQAANTVSITSTGSTTIQGNASANSDRTLTLGTGITVNTSAGVLLGSSTPNNSIVIAGSGATLTKAGSGTLTLRANNSFTGGTFLKAGTIAVLTNGNGLGTGTLTLGDNATGADVQVQASTLSVGNAITVAAGSGKRSIANFGGQSPTYSGPITLANNVSFDDSTFLRITGGISGTGNITVNASGNNANGMQFGDGTTFGGQINNDGTFTVANTGVAGDTTPVSVWGAASFGAKVTGIVQNSSTSLLLIRANDSSFAGTLTINAGKVRVETPYSNVGSSLSASNSVTMASGTTFELGNTDQTIAGLGGAGGTVQLGTGSTPHTLTIGGSGTFTSGASLNSNGSAGGVILSLAKTGIGTQTLTGNSAYNGTTAVSNGTLLVDGTNTTGDNVTVSSTGKLGGTGAIVLASGKTFAINGSSSAARAVLTPGDPTVSSGVGSLTLGSSSVTTSATLGANSQLAVDLTSTTSDTVNVFGTMTLTNGADLALSSSQLAAITPAAGQLYTIVNNDGTSDGYTGLLSYNGTLLAQGDTVFQNSAYKLLISYRGEGTTFDAGAGSGNNIVLQSVAVPEPSVLAAVGLGGLTLLRRKRR